MTCVGVTTVQRLIYERRALRELSFLRSLRKSAVPLTMRMLFVAQLLALQTDHTIAPLPQPRPGLLKPISFQYLLRLRMKMPTRSSRGDTLPGKT